MLSLPLGLAETDGEVDIDMPLLGVSVGVPQLLEEAIKVALALTELVDEVDCEGVAVAPPSQPTEGERECELVCEPLMQAVGETQGKAEAVHRRLWVGEDVPDGQLRRDALGDRLCSRLVGDAVGELLPQLEELGLTVMEGEPLPERRRIVADQRELRETLGDGVPETVRRWVRDALGEAEDDFESRVEKEEDAHAESDDVTEAEKETETL